MKIGEWIKLNGMSQMECATCNEPSRMNHFDLGKGISEGNIYMVLMC